MREVNAVYRSSLHCYQWWSSKATFTTADEKLTTYSITSCVYKQFLLLENFSYYWTKLSPWNFHLFIFSFLYSLFSTKNKPFQFGTNNTQQFCCCCCCRFSLYSGAKAKASSGSCAWTSELGSFPRPSCTSAVLSGDSGQWSDPTPSQPWKHHSLYSAILWCLVV